MQLYYQEHLPSETLRPYVYCFWTMTTDGQSDDVSSIQRCFPAGCIEWIIQLRGHVMQGLKDGVWSDYPRSIFTGICDKANEWVAYGRSELIGIRFTPEGAMRLFNPPLKEYHNSYLDADLLLGKRISPIIDQVLDSDSMKDRIFLIESFLHSQIKYQVIERNYFTEALRLIRHNNELNIGDLSKQVYVCDRQLQRSFQNQMGISPKGYHRVMRLYKAHNLGLIRQDNLTEIAYQMGYSDPAHFTRDFKKYFGVPPELHFNSINMKVMA